MVFGRKKSVVPARPVPPTVDQILEDLRTTGDQDPVYSLNQGLLDQLVEVDTGEKEGEVTQEDLGDPNILYQKVVEYVNAGGKVDQLAERIRSGFETLLTSQKELEELTEQVKTRVEDTRKRSNVTTANKKRNRPADELEENNRESEESDLC